MYHNVCRYEYLTFQTYIYLHNWHIVVTNNNQSEYAFLFPFSIYFWYDYKVQGFRRRKVMCINVTKVFAHLTWCLAYMIHMANLSIWHLAVTFNFDLFQGQICFRGPIFPQLACCITSLMISCQGLSIPKCYWQGFPYQIWLLLQHWPYSRQTEVRDTCYLLQMPVLKAAKLKPKCPYYYLYDRSQ